MFDFLKRRNKPKDKLQRVYTDEDIRSYKDMILDLSRDFEFLDELKDYTFELTSLNMYCDLTRVLFSVEMEPPVGTDETCYTPRIYLHPHGTMDSIYDELPDMDVYCQHGRKFRKLFRNDELLNDTDNVNWRTILESI